MHFELCSTLYLQPFTLLKSLLEISYTKRVLCILQLNCRRYYSANGLQTNTAIIGVEKATSDNFVNTNIHIILFALAQCMTHPICHTWCLCISILQPPFYAIENQTQIRFSKHWQVAKTVHTMFPIAPLLIKRFPFDPDKFTRDLLFFFLLSLHTNSRKGKQ